MLRISIKGSLVQILVGGGGGGVVDDGKKGTLVEIKLSFTWRYCILRLFRR